MEAENDGTLKRFWLNEADNSKGEVEYFRFPPTEEFNGAKIFHTSDFRQPVFTVSEENRVFHPTDPGDYLVYAAKPDENGHHTRLAHLKVESNELSQQAAVAR